MNTISLRSYLLCLIIFFSITFESHGQKNPIIEAIENRKPLVFERVSISSKQDDISPFVTDDRLYYLVNTGQAIVDNSEKKLKHKGTVDVYVCDWDGYNSFTNKRIVEGAVNSDANDGPIFINRSGTKMFLTRNSVFGKKSKKQSLSSTHTTVPLQIFSLDNFDGVWTNLEVLPFNKPNYSYAHPTLNKAEDQMIFSSNNGASIGGNDLFIVKRTKNGWGKPKNLGRKINTKKNEMFPFFLTDDIILFSTDGRAGPGGLDIFYANLKTLEVKPISSPINSNLDDFGVTVSSDGKHWFFSSNRRGSRGKDDIYHVYIEGEKQIVRKTKPSYTQPVVAQVDVKDEAIDDSLLPKPESIIRKKGLDGIGANYENLLKRYYYQEEINEPSYLHFTTKLSKFELKQIKKVVGKKLIPPSKAYPIYRVGPFDDILEAEKARQIYINKSVKNLNLFIYKNGNPLNANDLLQQLK